MSDELDIDSDTRARNAMLLASRDGAPYFVPDWIILGQMDWMDVLAKARKATAYEFTTPAMYGPSLEPPMLYGCKVAVVPYVERYMAVTLRDRRMDS